MCCWIRPIEREPSPMGAPYKAALPTNLVLITTNHSAASQLTNKPFPHHIRMMIPNRHFRCQSNESEADRPTLATRL